MEELRAELQKINKELFDLLKKRREISRHIQELKPQNGPYPHWDIMREKELFDSMKEQLDELSNREIAAFSLIIEDHACCGKMGVYPEWSKAEHLGGEFDILQQSNPLLLKDSSRQKLPLSENFQQLFDMVEKPHENH